MSQFNNKQEEQTRVNTFRGDFRRPRNEYNRDSTQRYNNRNSRPQRFNDNRGGNGQRNFQRRPGYNNERRGNNRSFNNSYRRGGYQKRPSNNRRRVVEDKDGWSTVKSSSNKRFNQHRQPVNSPIVQKTDNNKFNLLELEQPEVKKEIKDIPKVIKKKPVLQGAWGKGISSAVKEDVKFEKAPEKKEEDNGMLSLSNDLSKITNDVKNNSNYLFKPLGKNTHWGDMICDDEDEEYYSEDELYDDNRSVSSHNSNDYDEDWDNQVYY